MPGRGERGIGEVAGSQGARLLGVVTGAPDENGWSAFSYLLSGDRVIGAMSRSGPVPKRLVALAISGHWG
jgi:hypothetical protein